MSVPITAISSSLAPLQRGIRERCDKSPPKLTRNEDTSLTYDGRQEFRRFAGQRHPVSLHWMIKVTGNTTERTAKADEKTEPMDDDVERPTLKPRYSALRSTIPENALTEGRESFLRSTRKVHPLCAMSTLPLANCHDWLDIRGSGLRRSS